MSGNDICLLCDRGEIEDVGHFLDSCVEFEGERQIMLDELGRLEGAEGWLEEFGRGDSEKRVALLLGKSDEDMDDSKIGESDVSFSEMVEEEEGSLVLSGITKTPRSSTRPKRTQ